MSSLKRANKSAQRLHKERGQIQGQSGHLEKKKDYKIRARDSQTKRDTLKALERCAQNRNPDEFYFKMVNTVKKDGVHQERESTQSTYTDEQIKLMRTQDLRYINMKRQCESKKIDHLKSQLHLLDAKDKPKNRHTIFVDTKKEAEEFDAVKHFHTHPAFVDRVYNRPTIETLMEADIPDITEDTINSVQQEQTKQYKELNRRIEREKELRLIAQKLTVNNKLMDKKIKREKIADETPTSAAQYKWEFVRKR